MADYSCGNCGGETENEPLTLCDDCAAESQLADREVTILTARVEVLEKALRWYAKCAHGEECNCWHVARAALSEPPDG